MGEGQKSPKKKEKKERKVKRLPFTILEQPDDTTCGPTCLQAIYNYYQDPISLNKVIKEVSPVEGGGTLGVNLGIHALQRGYSVKIYSYNLLVFDPTWFSDPKLDLSEKLRQQMAVKKDPKLQFACENYLKFLDAGGQVVFQNLTPRLIRKYLKHNIPILTGLSATYLYQCPRELPNTDYDDVAGTPSGHFVVLSGYQSKLRSVHVADPWQFNYKHWQGKRYYWLDIDRVLAAILLGIVTYDANLIIIEKKGKEQG